MLRIYLRAGLVQTLPSIAKAKIPKPAPKNQAPWSEAKGKNVKTEEIYVRESPR
ncbi:hypothetical protein [Coleofasciculus sp.]|uniref:hypothetical protein n=1 Tax=Coleofasciculus sp. TaxID=3100458 RepID=UPI003A42A4F6